jgi:serine/threonine protein phosphatase PrpC
MRLFLDIGHCDRSVRRGVLAGRTIAIVSDAVTGSDHGALLACAEGLAERPDPERAAKTATTALGDTYYTAVETDAPQNALTEAFDAANIAVRSGGDRGRAAVLGGLVLHGRRWVVGHIGNVRVWRYRDQQIKQITGDHLVPRALRQTEVTRACGLAETVAPECDSGALQEGDVFLISSPGVHEVLPGPTILGVLQSDHTAQQMAELLTQRAISARATGYVGACVARVEKLPPPSADTSAAVTLPIAALPKPGEILDGFVVEKLTLRSRRFRLYRALDRESGETVTLRFPDPMFPNGTQAFLREERITRRIESPFILRPIALRQGRRTALYSALEHRRTEILASRIRRKHGLPLAETLHLGEQLLAALETLHGHGVIHRDVHPHSLFYDKYTRQLWMLGLGIEHGNAAAETSETPRASILSYWAPELFGGADTTERSDIYAAGATIYRMMSAAYPYGKIRSPADWRAARSYKPLRDRDAALPGELDVVLERACAVDPQQRYASAAQFTAALTVVRAKSVPERTSDAAVDVTGRPARWPWWLAGALAVGLAAYLYFTLR